MHPPVLAEILDCQAGDLLEYRAPDDP